MCDSTWIWHLFFYLIFALSSTHIQKKKSNAPPKNPFLGSKHLLEQPKKEDNKDLCSSWSNFGAKLHVLLDFSNDWMLIFRLSSIKCGDFKQVNELSYQKQLHFYGLIKGTLSRLLSIKIYINWWLFHLKVLSLKRRCQHEKKKPHWNLIWMKC